MEIDKERENVRSAWNWAVANVQVEQLEQALESLASFYQWRGHFREAEILLGKAVEMVSGLEREDTQCLRIRIMIWQSAFNRDLGQSDLAMQHANLALDLLDAPSLSNKDMRSFRAAALFCLGSVILRYDYEEALRIWHESYDLYKSIDDKWGMAKVLGYLSMIAWELGQLDKAKQIAEENLSLEKALGNQIGTGNMFSTLGWINLTQGQLYQAEELSQKCVQIYRQTGDQAFIAKGLRDASAPKIYLGRFDEAEILLEQSTSIYDELGGSGDLVFTNILLGATRVHLGQYDHARSLEQMSLKFAEKFNDRAGEGRALLWLGRVSLVEGLNTEAHQFLSKAAAIFQEIGKQDQLSSTLVSLAHSSLNLGNIPEARLNLKKALKISIDISVFLPLLFAFPVAALYAVKRGDKNRGIEIYSKVMRYAFVANSKWFADVFGAHIFDLNNPVQEEFVTAAQEQDMVLNLWSTARELLENPD